MLSMGIYICVLLNKFYLKFNHIIYTFLQVYTYKKGHMQPLRIPLAPIATSHSRGTSPRWKSGWAGREAVAGVWGSKS